MAAPNSFGTSSISDMHVIFASREVTGSNGRLINLNGDNGSTNTRFLVHAPLNANRAWYFDPGSTSNRSQSTAYITALNAKVIFSGYKSSADNQNGFRLNKGTRFTSSVFSSATVSGGLYLGADITNHDIFELILFPSKLTSVTETSIEDNLQAYIT
jgi:hypothetical protein